MEARYGTLIHERTIFRSWEEGRNWKKRGRKGLALAGTRSPIKKDFKWGEGTGKRLDLALPEKRKRSSVYEKPVSSAVGREKRGRMVPSRLPAGGNRM